MRRVYDFDELAPVFYGSNPNVVGDFSLEDWLLDEKNIALRVGDDYSMFEADSKDVYSGHYLFKSRGGAAESVAKDMLSEMADEYGARVIKGIVPVDKLGARSLTRRLGFSSFGEIETPAGPCELFIKVM